MEKFKYGDILASKNGDVLLMFDKYTSILCGICRPGSSIITSKTFTAVTAVGTDLSENNLHIESDYNIATRAQEIIFCKEFIKGPWVKLNSSKSSKPKVDKGVFLENEDGICIVDHIDDQGGVVEIVGLLGGKITYKEDFMIFDNLESMRPASVENAEKLLLALKRIGKKYDHKTKTVDSIFNPGDVLVSENGYLVIYKRMSGDYQFESYVSVRPLVGDVDYGVKGFALNSFSMATPEAADRIFSSLAKIGKRWNPETMEVEDIEKELWRAEKNGAYYTPFNGNNNFFDHRDKTDNLLYESGFYCKTKDQNNRLYTALKQAAAEFWKEELK